jgi:hypothetical protein
VADKGRLNGVLSGAGSFTSSFDRRGITIIVDYLSAGRPNPPYDKAAASAHWTIAHDPDLPGLFIDVSGGIETFQPADPEAVSAAGDHSNDVGDPAPDWVMEAGTCTVRIGDVSRTVGLGSSGDWLIAIETGPIAADETRVSVDFSVLDVSADVFVSVDTLDIGILPRPVPGG